MVVCTYFGCDFFGVGVESDKETWRNNWFRLWVRGISLATHVAHGGGGGRDLDFIVLFGHLDRCCRNRDFDHFTGDLSTDDFMADWFIGN